MYIDGRIVHQKKYYEVQEPNQTFKSIHHGGYHWLEGTTITSKTASLFLVCRLDFSFFNEIIFFGRFFAGVAKKLWAKKKEG